MTNAYLSNGHRTPSSSAFIPPASSPKTMSSLRQPSELDRATLDAFRKVKPLCMSLLSIGAQAPTSFSHHAGLVDTLAKTVTSFGPTVFSRQLVNLILGPVTQILVHHDPLALPDNFLEATFRYFALIIGQWKQTPGGIDAGTWEQLWRFTVGSIAPRVLDEGKGKGKAVGQEVQLQAVLCLTALLEPSLTHPNQAMLDKVAKPDSPLVPTLFRSISLLLAMVQPEPAHGRLQLASLRLLRFLVKIYLEGKHRLLASILPGTISSVSKLFKDGGNKLKGDIATEATGLVEDVVVATLSDADLQKLGILRAGLDDLGQLAEQLHAMEEEPAVPSPDSSGKDPFPPLTKSYLEFTATQLRTTLRPIMTDLMHHPSDTARRAVSSLSYALLASCQQSLPHLGPVALSTLLRLSKDDFDPVRLDAQERLRSLLHGTSTTLQLETALIDLLGEAMNALPRLILSHQEAKVIDAAQLLSAIADTTSGSHAQNPMADLLGPRGKVERWGWALLDCLEFGRPTGWSSTDNAASQTAAKGWISGFGTSGLPLLLDGASASNDDFPALPLRYIEAAKTVRAVKAALMALGSAGGEAALHAVDHFVSIAKANRSRAASKAASALWTAQLLLDGIAQGQVDGPEGKVGKATRKMAREMTRVMVSIDEADDEDDYDYEGEDESKTEEDGLVPVERQKGLDVVTTLLDRPLRDNTYAAKETRRLHLQAQRTLLTALSLSTLSLTSRILSSSFRPLLLTALYTLLSHLGSPHALIATYAEIALNQVAYNTGYASVQNLILDNVDYVINVVSQRLNPTRLSPNAPLVLIAMIRLTGSEIVPMVHDVVDEIFDALDDYHGYEVLASGLLAVLVTLIDVMADDVASRGITEERVKKLADLRRMGKPPNPQDDFARFQSWWKERQKSRSEEVNRILERAPEHAWGKRSAQDGEPGEQEEESHPAEEEEPKATRSEEITALILDKCLNFLSHRSPFLRAKILSLIARAIPVLASGNREGDLLPLIDRSWGIILLRLDDPLPYVVTEAAEVIASLCENVGDFMSRRVLDHAWPKLKKLMEAQKAVDDRSALARKGAVGTTSQWTVSHRLHKAILRIVTFVAREVPVDDNILWDMMVVFRPFLDKRAHEEIQHGAVKLYAALAVRDEDALWTVLQATMGDGDGVWGYLKTDRLDIGNNARKVLQSDQVS